MENDQKTLQGVEFIYWDKSSLCFVGSTAAVMRYLGEQVTDDYIMGISGGAFKTFWHPSWAVSNDDLLVYGEEPIRRTFAALGYDYQYIPREDHLSLYVDAPKTREQFKPLLVQSINDGVPVIAQGIVGPPECCVVTGYNLNGEILYGTSYYQEKRGQYFSIPGWTCFGAILIGKKHRKPTQRTILKDSLQWAIELIRKPSFEGMPASVSHTPWHLNGLVAYEAMASALLRDEEYSIDDMPGLVLRCRAIAEDGIWLLSDERRSAAIFLDGMAEKDFPGAEELKKAAEEYRKESAFLLEVAKITPGSWGKPENIQKMADHDLRRALAARVLEAREMEVNAVEWMEKSLAQLKAKK